jgi:hypothetical protein
MAEAPHTIFKIKRATTDLRMRLGVVVFVRAPLRSHLPALEDLWSRVQTGLLRRRPSVYRTGCQTLWTALPETSKRVAFEELFGMTGAVGGVSQFELAERSDETDSQHAGLLLSFSSLAPIRGMHRLSHIRVLFPDEAPVGTIAAFGEWAISHLPVWWGSGGVVFHHTAGTMFTAHAHAAALAKRYWGAQILDLPSLQWDGLGGMPSVNWLSLIGNEFALSKEVSIERLSADATSLNEEGISYRQGAEGIALAAGSKPVYGDINAAEPVDAYVRVSKLIQPLLLTSHTPLFGPFAKPEVLNAWLGRWQDPRSWLECDIATD